MRFEDFTEMPVWQLAFALLLRIYQVTKTFPVDERFGLVSEMRRSANSVVHNIAEGFGRYEPRGKTRFYKISRGSAYELTSQVLAAHALGYIMDVNVRDELVRSCRDVIKELSAVMKKLES